MAHIELDGRYSVFLEGKECTRTSNYLVAERCFNKAINTYPQAEVRLVDHEVHHIIEKHLPIRHKQVLDTASTGRF